MSDNKFYFFQKVTHRGGGIYQIVGIPDHRKLEHCNESFYEYQSVEDGQVWVRRKSEMEDGRFVSGDALRQADTRISAIGGH